MTEDQWSFWIENGYVIIPNAVPLQQVERLVELLWIFEDKKASDPDTWYRKPLKEIEMKELVGSGMVEIYNHQFLWDNRQYPRVYHAFCDIWGMEELWVSIDRANLNLPLRKGDVFKGFIHWDLDTSDPNRSNNVQGVLSLSDTSSNTGGFQCIPELFRNFDSWVQTQPKDRNPFQPNIEGFRIEQIETKAGDLLIWNSMLPHGISPNRSDHARMAQYISMTPAQEDNEQLREWRVKSWKERIAPEGFAFPGDPRNWEKLHAKTAQLSPLGEKLLGLKSWKS